jgi:hypothetical protein
MSDHKLIDFILKDMSRNNDTWADVTYCSLDVEDLRREVVYSEEMTNKDKDPDEPVEYIIYTNRHIYFMITCGEDENLGGYRYKRCSASRKPVLEELRKILGVKVHGYLTGNRLEDEE